MMGGQIELQACVKAVEKFGHATDYALMQAIEYAMGHGSTY
jgi:hypothetical protein